MWIALIGLLVGVSLGVVIPVQVPVAYARYLSIAFIACLDSVLGGTRAILDGSFDGAVFVTGFFGNALLAAMLTYIGDRMGVELYYAALFALGYRMFQNLGVIRRGLLKRTKREKGNVVESKNTSGIFGIKGLFGGRRA